MPDVSRRTFIQHVAATAALLPVINLSAAPGDAVTQPVDEQAGNARGRLIPTLRWLNGAPAGGFDGATLGVPWPRGMVQPKQPLTISVDGKAIATQTWPLAYWPDGSLKWTGHAVSAEIAGAKAITVEREESPAPAQPITT